MTHRGRAKCSGGSSIHGNNSNGSGFELPSYVIGDNGAELGGVSSIHNDDGDGNRC